MPQFDRLDLSCFEKLKIVKLRPGHIYNFEPHNMDISKNSGYLTVFQVCPDSDIKTNAVAHVLASMLNGPAFDYLRTKEKLGYIVKVSKESFLNVSHISIFVQSAKFDPDYIEVKVNDFLTSKFREYQKGCQASVDNNIQSIVNHINQKP